MKFIIYRLCILICFLLLLTFPVWAEVPLSINYQGYLTDDMGSPVPDGIYSIQFTIYSTESGSSNLWSSGVRSIQVTDGFFTHLLGSIAPMPVILFDSDSSRYLGITVGTDPECIPRTKISSAAYAYHTAIADHADVADDLSAGASVDPSKIDGTAAVLADKNTFTKVNTFQSDVLIEDADLAFRRGGWHRWRLLENDTSGLQFKQVYSDGGVLKNDVRLELFDDGKVGIGGYDSTCKVLIADSSSTSVFYNSALKVDYKYSGSSITNGIYSKLLYLTTSDDAYSIRATVKSNTGNRVGLFAYGETIDFNLETGNSYGVYADANDGNTSYGIYAAASSALTNWAGFFSGNVRVIGTLDNSKSTLRIDHPIDPDNMILEHAGINSPEMLNVYSGNISTDKNGEAVVILPDYFEALNTDCRYQLTVIGSFAQAIIKQEVNGNQFIIATSEPNIKVSWQVIGVRTDAFATKYPVNVETEKNAEEMGYYINPSAFGFDLDRSLEYINNSIFRDELDKRKGK